MSHDVPCEDCGSTDWRDWTLLPHEVFNAVCPGGDGYLCLSCFAKRVLKLETPMSDLTINIAEGTVIRPGDTVLLALPAGTRPTTASELREQWERLMPDTPVVFVLGAESVAVQRKDEAPTDQPQRSFMDTYGNPRLSPGLRTHPTAPGATVLPQRGGAA